MSLILGMDVGVFIAWIGTLLATVLCIVYGLYYQFIKKASKKHSIVKPMTKEKEQKGDS